MLIRLFYCHNFRMHNRPLQLLTCIMPTTNNLTVFYDDTTDRNFIIFQSNSGFF